MVTLAWEGTVDKGQKALSPHFNGHLVDDSLLNQILKNVDFFIRERSGVRNAWRRVHLSMLL